MKNGVFIIVFIAITLAELYSEISGNRSLHLISKPLLVIILFIYALQERATHDNRAKTLVLVGLFFSWIGDCVLMFRQEYSWAFLGGLGAFFLAHLMYIWAYRVGRQGAFTLSYFAFVPIIGYGVVLYSILAPYLASMKIPVALYALALLGMFVTALERSGRTSPRSFWMVLSGATLFVVSDSVLAWSIFVENSGIARIIVMSSYASAQMLITFGMVAHWKEVQ